MTEIEPRELSDEEARARAEEFLKPGKFNFLERLAGRNMPTDEVDIYLDEATAHRIQKLEIKLLKASNNKERLSTEKQIDALKEKARESRYTIHLTAISVEDYDELVDMAREQFPIEYTESRNPLTMALERQVVPNDDREVLFRTHYWAKSITKVVNVAGDADEDITPEWVGFFLGHAPLMAMQAVQSGIEGLRMVSGWMDRLQGEDFLAKS